MYIYNILVSCLNDTWFSGIYNKISILQRVWYSTGKIRLTINFLCPCVFLDLQWVWLPSVVQFNTSLWSIYPYYHQLPSWNLFPHRYFSTYHDNTSLGLWYFCCFILFVVHNLFHQCFAKPSGSTLVRMFLSVKFTAYQFTCPYGNYTLYMIRLGKVLSSYVPAVNTSGTIYWRLNVPTEIISPFFNCNSELIMRPYYGYWFKSLQEYSNKYYISGIFIRVSFSSLYS